MSEVNKIANYNQMMSWLTRPEPTTPAQPRENFSIGTQEPVIASNDFSNIQVADLKDDLEPGPLKDEMDGNYDPSLEESTTGPAGYPLTAGKLDMVLNPIETAKDAKNLIETGTVKLKQATKLVKDFLNKRQNYQGANEKKDFTPEKNFFEVFGAFRDKFFGGDFSAASRGIGESREKIKGIFDRMQQSTTGERFSSGLGKAFDNKNIAVPEPKNGIPYTEVTSNMKKNPESFDNLFVRNSKTKRLENKFLDPESLGHHFGMKFPRDKQGYRKGIGKYQYDAFSNRLRDLGVKFKVNLQGKKEYNVNDALNKLLSSSQKKIIKGDRKSDIGKGRYDTELKFDPDLFRLRNNIKNRVSKRSQDLDTYLPNAVDDVGHPYSLTKSQEKYKKLFKDSNINQINTLVYQDSLINSQLFKNSGYERKYDKMFDTLSKFQNKKVTPEIRNEILKVKKDMNDNYNYIQNIIKDPKLLDKYVNSKNQLADKKFINYLTNQGDRIQKIDVRVPKVGENFESKDIFVDMSKVNPKYIMGYINNINPNAKKFKDLSLSEQEIYKNNVLQQNSEIVSEYLNKAKFPSDDVEAVKETISMDYATGGRVGFNKGTPPEGTTEGGSAAAAGAATLLGKYAKPLLKGALRTIGSPTVAGLFARDTIKENLAEGESLPRAIIDKEVGVEFLYPEIAKQVAGKTSSSARGVLGALGRFALNPIGKAARVLTPAGAIITAAGLAKDYYDFAKRDLEEKAADPEAYKAKQDEQMGISAADGGLISLRENFADGPDDPSKRKFMKIAGGLASIPIVGRFFDVASQAPKVAEAVKRTAEGVPDFLIDLIAKVKAKAEATGMKYFTGNRSDEFTDVYKADNYVISERGNKTIIREVDQDGDMLYKENQIEIEVDPETGGVTYREASARPDAEGKLKDVEEYIEDDDLENMKKYTYDE